MKAIATHHAFRHGFTLIELLVVIAIIAILASMLLPALGGAKASAREAICKARFKQVGVIFNLYVSDNDDNTWATSWFHQNCLHCNSPVRSQLDSYAGNTIDIFFCPEFRRGGESPSASRRKDFWNGGIEGGITYRGPGLQGGTPGNQAIVYNNLNFPRDLQRQLRAVGQNDAGYGVQWILSTKLSPVNSNAIVFSEQYASDSGGWSMGPGCGWFGDRWHGGDGMRWPRGGNILFLDGAVFWSKVFVNADWCCALVPQPE